MKKKKILATKTITCSGLAQVITVTVWQDIDRTWLEVDRVYATRYDCMAGPE